MDRRSLLSDLPATGEESGMTDTPWTRATYRPVLTVETAAHELEHALSARRYGYPVIFMTIIPGPAYDGFTYVDYSRTFLSPTEAVHAGEIDRQAADIAIRLVQITPELRELAAIEIDAAAVTEAAVARLSPDHAAVVRACLTGEHDATSFDDAKTERLAVVFGDDQARYMAAARGLAWKHATADYPLLEALLPTLLRARVLTGADLEQAITDLEPTLGDAPMPIDDERVNRRPSRPMTNPMPASDANFDRAASIHEAAYVAERAAEALSGARLEVSRRQEEVDTRTAEIAALPASTDELRRSRLGTALRVAGERLSWAVKNLERVEEEKS